MKLKPLFLYLISISVVLAQPIDARNELIYPVNPPKMVFPQPGMEGNVRIVRTAPLVGTVSSFDAFLRAYKKYQEGERLKSMQKTEAATYCFAEALSELIALQKSDKDFQPKIVANQLNKTKEHLSELISRFHQR